MADVGGEEHFVLARTWNHEIGVIESTGSESAVDSGPVSPPGQTRPLSVRQAEPPVLAVVRRHERDRIRLLGKRVEMGLQILEVEFDIDWVGIADDVE